MGVMFKKAAKVVSCLKPAAGDTMLVNLNHSTLLSFLNVNVIMYTQVIIHTQHSMVT